MDLDRLARDLLGVPIVWNPKLQVYRIDGAGSGEHQELPGVGFSEREIHALRDDLRSFGIDAIESATTSDKPSVSADGQTLKTFFDDSYGIFNCKPDKVAELKFTLFRAQWVAKELWHPQQTGKMLADGSYLLEIPYRMSTEIVREILKEGPEVEVLGPETLRKEVRDLAHKLVSRYV